MLRADILENGDVGRGSGVGSVFDVEARDIVPLLNVIKKTTSEIECGLKNKRYFRKFCYSAFSTKLIPFQVSFLMTSPDEVWK